MGLTPDKRVPMAKQALSSKFLVTNRSALRAKYGSAGVSAIEAAVKALATADAARGFATRLVYLDGASVGAARVTDPTDPAENKAAVDALARKHRPEYLVILGSHDVVPYQDLKNKLHDPGRSGLRPRSLRRQRPAVRLRGAVQPERGEVPRPDPRRRPHPRHDRRRHAVYLIALLKAERRSQGRSRAPTRALRSPPRCG